MLMLRIRAPSSFPSLYFSGEEQSFWQSLPCFNMIIHVRYFLSRLQGRTYNGSGSGLRFLQGFGFLRRLQMGVGQSRAFNPFFFGVQDFFLLPRQSF